MLTRLQLETLNNQTLSNNRSPLTRGDELNSLIESLIGAIFEYKQVFIKDVSNSTGVTVLSTEHLLPSINGIRCEDTNGFELFIPNKIDRSVNSVTIYPSVATTFKLIIF